MSIEWTEDNEVRFAACHESCRPALNEFMLGSCICG
jgi:hypothetical protein